MKQSESDINIGYSIVESKQSDNDQDMLTKDFYDMPNSDLNYTDRRYVYSSIANQAHAILLGF